MRLQHVRRVTDNLILFWLVNVVALRDSSDADTVDHDVGQDTALSVNERGKALKISSGDHGVTNGSEDFRPRDHARRMKQDMNGSAASLPQSSPARRTHANDRMHRRTDGSAGPLAESQHSKRSHAKGRPHQRTNGSAGSRPLSGGAPQTSAKDTVKQRMKEGFGARPQRPRARSNHGKTDWGTWGPTGSMHDFETRGVVSGPHTSSFLEAPRSTSEVTEHQAHFSPEEQAFLDDAQTEQEARDNLEFLERMKHEKHRLPGPFSGRQESGSELLSSASESSLNAEEEEWMQEFVGNLDDAYMKKREHKKRMKELEAAGEFVSNAAPEGGPYSKAVSQRETWIYNPFRKYFGHIRNTLASDLDCPPMDIYLEARHNMTYGEVVLCQIRYTTLIACELPATTCTMCNCERESEIKMYKASGCVPRTCYLKLPLLWLQWYVALPTLVLLCHLGISPLLKLGFQRAMRWKQFHEIVVIHVGTPDAAPEKTQFRIYLLVVQIMASGLNVFIYCVLDCYESQNLPWKVQSIYLPEWNSWLQFFLNLQMLVNFMVTWTKNGFTGTSLITINALIDIMTVHSTLMRQCLYNDPDPPLSKGFSADVELLWLAISRPKMNWQFMRAYRCLSALMEIQSMGALKKFSPVQQQFMKTGLRLWALVNIFTGMTQVLEWLGHDLAVSSSTSEHHVTSVGDCNSEVDLQEGNIACIPFLVGIYWVFTTISSVGYGDYGPASAPTYLLVIFFIVAGVTFFSVETQTLLDVVEEQGSGARAASIKDTHVVLTGGAMRDIDASILQPFISQLFHRAVVEQGGDWPELVILGNVKDYTKITEFMNTDMTGDMRRNTQFCNADPLTPGALTQAKVHQAAVVYILPSTLTSDVDVEDEYNTNVALSVKSLTKTPFRLLLFRMRSIEIAMSSGILAGQCCSINYLRSCILAQSTRVRGWAHALALMTTNVATNIEGAKAFCHDALFPEPYFKCLSHTLRGFALLKYAAGAEFHELALDIYRETGALAICMVTKKDRFGLFPWAEVSTPDSIIFCLHSSEFVTDPRAKKFVSPVNWQQLLVQWHRKKDTLRIGDAGTDFALDYELDEEVATDEDMSAMQEKAQAIINSDANDFALIVMTEDADMWLMMNMYLQRFLVVSESITGNSWGLIILSNGKPPSSLLMKVRALEPEVAVAFVQGSWNKPGDLIDAGAERCKVLFAFPSTPTLCVEPEEESRIFFFISVLKNLNLRKETLILLELGSGTMGSHVLPMHNLTPRPPQRVAAEIAFNPPCANGMVFVPRMIMGLLAKTYYTFGILEVFQTLVTDLPDQEDAHPEQITVPGQLVTKTFGYAVESFLQKRIGPCPILLLGMLRETLDGEVVMLKPEKTTRVLPSDLFIVLMDKVWAAWADQKGLRCMGGRSKRSAQMSTHKAAESTTIAGVGVVGDESQRMRATVSMERLRKARGYDGSVAIGQMRPGMREEEKEEEWEEDEEDESY